MGIPYGQHERFKKPEPAEKWSGIYFANRKIECAQECQISHFFNAFLHKNLRKE